MIILGIDPGTTRIGYGLIKKEGNKLTCLDYGIVKTASSGSNLDYTGTFASLSKLVSEYSPSVGAVEKLYFFKNQKTIIPVSEMRGVIMYALAHHGVQTYEYTPLQIKQAVSSYGRADKQQVQKMVRLILGLNEEIKPDDAADGLAIAICCANNIMPIIK